MQPTRTALLGIHRALIDTWAEHPQMADTVEGIARFWLQGEDITRVLFALNRLVNMGLARRRGDGQDAMYLAGDVSLLRQWAGREPAEQEPSPVLVLRRMRS